MTCNICNTNKKANRKAKGSLGSYHAGAPMERLHIDILGPLQITKKGNCYILMVVDQFTKWTECLPLPVQAAERVDNAVVDEILSKFCYPA